MKYIKTDWDIPYYNLALEEYIMTQLPLDEYLFFYIHSPSIIIGRNQNTVEEINHEFVKENDITVARRLSGGGAVYHDGGNLNFSFIMPYSEEDLNNFKKLSKPIVNALNEMGLPAEYAGRNDILLDGKKISGNAQYNTNGRILHHGTLLYYSDMKQLTSALKVKDLKIKSKSIKSVKSRVTNIKEYFKDDISIYEFKERIIGSLKEQFSITEYKLTHEDKSKLNSLVQDKFSTADWNFGRSPVYDIKLEDKFSCGIIDLRLTIENGRIKNCKIYGDFFANRDIHELEDRIKGTSISENELRNTLSESYIKEFFPNIEYENFLKLFNKLY